MFATTTYERTPDGALLEHRAELPDEEVRYRLDISTSHGSDWATNGLRWAKREDAAIWGRDLAMRWFGCTDIRLVDEATGETVEVLL